MSSAATPHRMLDWAVAAAPHPGEAASGDLHVVASFDGGALVAVIDGLGHGPEAALAARAAGETLARFADEPVEALVLRCHQVLARLRGATLSLASFDARASTMSWIGVGNVEAVLLQRTANGMLKRERLLVWGGVVGGSLPKLRPSALPVGRGDRLVMATDGLRPGFADKLRSDGGVAEIAGQLLAAYATGADDALALVADYMGAPP